jgi:hypothetical protein
MAAGVLLAALLAAGEVFFHIVDSGRCGYETVGEFPSPNNDRKAMVVVENCGATVDFASSVFVTTSGRSVDFKNDYLFSVKGLNDIQVVWNDNNSIKVSYRKPDRINRQAAVWRGERIQYEERQ